MNNINPLRGHENVHRKPQREELERMIFTGDKAKIEKILKTLKAGRVMEDLGNGFVLAEVKKNSLPNIYKALPEGMNVFKDEKVGLVEPEELKQSRELEKMRQKVGVKTSEEAQSLPEKNVTLQITGADKVHEMGYKGQGLVLAVIDTGVANHDDWGSRLTYHFDATSSGHTKPHDGHGHGTHVAGIAAGDGKFTGLAPSSEIWGIKVLSDGGSGYTSDIIRGINKVVEKAKEEGKKVVANMSLGGYAFKPWNQDPLALAVEKAIQDGVYFAIAAGNSGPTQNTVGTPAIAPNAVTVAAYQDKKTEDLADDDIARFSSRGPVKNAPDETSKLKPDVSMPGVQIWAANTPGSELDRLAKQGRIPVTADGKYIAISGTSMATPGVAGAMLLILNANPNLTQQQVKDLLMKHAIKLTKTDPTDNKPYDQFDQGSGLVNVYEAVKEALSMLPPPPPPPSPEPNPEPNPE
ncbi:MAG: S8 family serine peptidase, partial [Candidatus Calescibacterium sp.]|nr:S8 family serine peptidase [Candidatus Calescibacterium sp.]